MRFQHNLKLILFLLRIWAYGLLFAPNHKRLSYVFFKYGKQFSSKVDMCNKADFDSTRFLL